jgi:hypothetical protein
MRLGIWHRGVHRIRKKTPQLKPLRFIAEEPFYECDELFYTLMLNRDRALINEGGY